MLDISAVKGQKWNLITKSYEKGDKKAFFKHTISANNIFTDVKIKATSSFLNKLFNNCLTKLLLYLSDTLFLF